MKKKFAGHFGGIRPTAMERRYGRLLRAPDHDASTGGDDDGAAAEAAKAAKVAEEAASAAAAAAAAEEVKDLASAKEALKAANDRAAKAERDAAKAREAADKYKGIDPVKARENEKKVSDAEKAAREAERAKAEAEGNFEKLRQIQNEEFEEKFSAERTRADEAEKRATAAEEKAARALTTSAFAGSNFILNDTILSPIKAARLFGEHVEVEGDDVVVYDAPRGSKRAKIMDSRGNPIPFDQAIRKVVEADSDRDLFLRSKVKPGAGSKSEDGKPTNVPKDRISRLSAGLKALREDK